MCRVYALLDAHHLASAAESESDSERMRALTAIEVSPRPRVLIVEDDEDTREMYAWCMRAAGWLVDVAADGAEALLAVPMREPDVIVMDLHMPVLGGLDAIRRLKRNDATMHIPVVAYTAFEPRSSEIAARHAGCDEFVAKARDPEALRDVLEATVALRTSYVQAGSRHAYSFTMCIRDDDAKTFEFLGSIDATGITDRVAAAIASGRHLRCYLLEAGPLSREREERYLASKGYSQATVKLAGR
jgi:two-component system cell cycle response regulator DivK